MAKFISAKAAALKSNDATGNLAPDLDYANIALMQAHAIIDMLTVAADGVSVPDTCTSTLVQCLFAVQGEIERARTALGFEVAHG